MCDYDYDYKLKQRIEAEISNNYDLKNLESQLEYHQQKTKEIMANLELKELALRKQIEVARATDLRPFVLLHRFSKYDNKIHYEVVLCQIPNIPAVLEIVNDQSESFYWRGQEKIPAKRGDLAFKNLLVGYSGSQPKNLHYPRSDRREFTGKERKAAHDYAAQLAKDNKATLMEVGL